MITTSSNNTNLVNFLEKHYTVDNVSEMAKKPNLSTKATPLAIIRSN